MAKFVFSEMLVALFVGFLSLGAKAQVVRAAPIGSGFVPFMKADGHEIYVNPKTGQFIVINKSIIKSSASTEAEAFSIGAADQPLGQMQILTLPKGPEGSFTVRMPDGTVRTLKMKESAVEPRVHTPASGGTST